MRDFLCFRDEHESEAMETHIPGRQDPKTKKPWHCDSKTRKPRHQDSGTKTPRHQETEIIKSSLFQGIFSEDKKPWHPNSKTEKPWHQDSKTKKAQPQVFVKFWPLCPLVKKAVRKTFAIFTGITVRPATLLKRDPNTDLSLWILQNFYKHLFWRTSAFGCLWK